MRMNSDVAPLLAWLESRRSSCDMTVEMIRRSDSDQWRLVDGRIVHRSGGFFSLVGLEPGGVGVGPGLDQPIIDQPEIGLLGFLVRERVDGIDVLVQAKPEPGNVGRTQLAPSVQATESNLRRRHGGRPTRLLELFDLTADILSNTLQSEQGTRFRAKYNQNMWVRVTDELDDLGDHLQWFAVEHVLEALLADFSVNTDARSLLATCPWPVLARGGQPFARWAGTDGFGERLYHSYRLRSARGETPRDVIAWLGAQRIAYGFDVRLMPIDQLGTWQMDDWRIFSAAHPGLEVRHVRVQSSEREVGLWDQPLIAADSEGTATLLCQERAGGLRFLFVARAEPGFDERVQLGPSFQEAAGPQGLFARLACREQQLASTLQSDEGGRFLNSVSRYAVIELDPGLPVPEFEGAVWLTLGQIAALIPTKGVFTNEVRSLISLIVAFL
jgi:oxidase EvaA